MSTKNRAQQVMNEYYSKLGPGPYYYDNSAVAAAIRAMADSFVYDDNGMVWVTANDFYEIARDLEALK